MHVFIWGWEGDLGGELDWSGLEGVCDDDILLLGRLGRFAIEEEVEAQGWTVRLGGLEWDEDGGGEEQDEHTYLPVRNNRISGAREVGGNGGLGNPTRLVQKPRRVTSRKQEEEGCLP